MPKVVCNTSPIQYLHQAGLLTSLPALAGRVVVPPAVVEELAAGRALGVDLPELAALAWVDVPTPVSAPAVPLVTDLGPGETQVLMLALEQPDTVAVLDDALARRAAEVARLRFTGTLGLLLDAKRAGLIAAVKPYVEKLESLGFRLAAQTRATILSLAGEDG